MPLVSTASGFVSLRLHRFFHNFIFSLGCLCYLATPTASPLVQFFLFHQHEVSFTVRLFIVKSPSVLRQELARFSLRKCIFTLLHFISVFVRLGMSSAITYTPFKYCKLLCLPKTDLSLYLRGQLRLRIQR
jgi:hypothetical protein